MAMKRKASSAFKDDDDAAASEPRRAPPQLGDYLIAEEILPRLPARAAAACAVGPLRGILTGVDYWRVRNRRRRLLPRPRFACFVVSADSAGGAGFRHEFHYADAAFPAEPLAVHAAGRTLAAYCYGGSPAFRLRRGLYAPFSRVPAVRAADGTLAPFRYGAARFVDGDGLFSEHPAVTRAAGGTLAPFRYAGTCNGLVLLTSPWDNGDRARGVLFNPATGGEEETVVLDMARGGGGKDVFRCFCGLGYSPSRKTYKALVCARDFTEDSCAGELVAVPFGGAGDEEKPRTVAKLVKLSERGEYYFSSITLDGKVYVLPDILPAAAVLAFDVDGETVTLVPLPLPWRVDKGYVSELMELWGRPCIATGDRDASTLWTLTPEHRWERRCTLAATAPGPTTRGDDDDVYNYDHATIHGAWDCGDGFLFALFRDGRGFVYDLRETETTTPGGGGPATHARRLPEEAAAAAPMAELLKATFCWGYQPTLVPPATVFGGYVCPEKKRDGLRHLSSSRRNWIHDSERRRCLEDLMEMMRKRPQRREEPAARMNK